MNVKTFFNLLRLGSIFFQSLACQLFFLIFAQTVESVSALVSGSALNGGGEIGLSHSLLRLVASQSQPNAVELRFNGIC